jgi:hypothetical protein
MKESLYTVLELRVIAKNVGIKGYRTLRKAELLDEINKVDSKLLAKGGKPQAFAKLNYVLTLLASLASIIGLVIALIPFIYSYNQTNGLQTDTPLLEQQKKNDEVESRRRLRTNIMAIYDKYPNHIFFDDARLTKMSRDEKATWFIQVRHLLESELDNPSLIRNTQCLERWKKAATTAKVTSGLIEVADSPDVYFKTYSYSIYSDVEFVWNELKLAPLSTQ